MNTLRTLALLASLTAAILQPLHAQPAATTDASPASAAEIAYWIQVQKEISELRSANAAAGLSTGGLINLEATKISAAATRIEDFLDRRDRDPVGDLGSDFLAYRETLIKLMEYALAPVTGAAAFQSKGISSGEDRMYAVMANLKQIGELDGYKPRLALQHEKLFRRVVAGGGPALFFFQTIGLGDKPSAPGTLATPEERDAQFLADSQAIHPVLGEIVPAMFIEPREKMGVSGESIMSEMLKTFSNFRERFSDASNQDLEQVLAEQGPTRPDGSFNLPRRLIQLELLRRREAVVYNIAMQEWQGAFARWTGKASAVAPVGLSDDVAVAADGSWFAYSPSETTLAVHTAATGELQQTVDLPEPIRAFAATNRDDLVLFTNRGVYVVDPTVTPARIDFQAERRSNFVVPHIAASTVIDRQVYGLGVMPAVANDDGSETTFSNAEATSTITAVAISGDGRRFAYGHGGDNVTGSGAPRYGFDVLEFDPGPITLGEGASINVKSDRPRLRHTAVAALALDRSGDRAAAAWTGRFNSSVTFTDLTGETPQQSVLTYDNQPYSWIALLEEGDLRIIAGTREGVVRIWDVATRALISRFEVPAGPGGVGYALVGGDLLTVCVGSPGLHRWKIADGSLVATFLGEAPASDAAQLAARLEAERKLIPTRDLIVTLFDNGSDNDKADLKIIQQLRSEHAAQLVALGQQGLIDYQLAGIRTRQIHKLEDDDRDLEAFELGMKEISAGLLDDYLFLATIRAGNYALSVPNPNEALRKRVIELAERAVGLYPSDVDLQVELIEAKIRQLAVAGNFTDSLKQIDELDLLEPSRAPHASLRLFINHTAANASQQAGNSRAAIGYFMQALRFTNDNQKELQLHFGESVFALGCQIEDWNSALQGANIVLNLNPAKQNDQNFMYWARHAYQQVNGKK